MHYSCLVFGDVKEQLRNLLSNQNEYLIDQPLAELTGDGDGWKEALKELKKKVGYTGPVVFVDEKDYRLVCERLHRSGFEYFITYQGDQLKTIKRVLLKRNNQIRDPEEQGRFEELHNFFSDLDIPGVNYETRDFAPALMDSLPMDSYVIGGQWEGFLIAPNGTRTTSLKVKDLNFQLIQERLISAKKLSRYRQIQSEIHDLPPAAGWWRLASRPLTSITTAVYCIYTYFSVRSVSLCDVNEIIFL